MPTSQTTMPASPPALRLRRPGWRDPRLLLGLVLVALSVALGAWAVGQAGRTVDVLAASSPLLPGDPVDPADLVVRQVRMSDGMDLYLAADDAPSGPLVATRSVGAGELVPREAVAAAADLGVRPVAVTPTGVLSSDVVEGSLVDLWFVPAPASSGSAETVTASPPEQLAEAVAVAEVAEESGAFAVGSGSTVQVLIPVDELPQVLAALAADGTVAVVPVPGGVRTP